MTTKRQQLIEQLIEQYIIFHHEIARIKSRRAGEVANKAQLGILFILDRFGSMSVARLAEMVHTTSGAVSQLADNLQAQDLIARQSSGSDRRVVELTLTAQGRHRLKLDKSSRLAAMSWVFDNIAEEEIEAIVKTQSKMLQNLTKYRSKHQSGSSD